jgi:chromosome partitioning protein
MQTIAFISQKGGAGKTTLALHLTAAYTLSGLDTALIDLDPQASAAKWSDRREADLPVVLSAHASRLENEIRRVEELGGDVLVIDTAPHSDSAALEAARRADLVVVPCRPAILDIEAVANTLSLVGTTGTPVVVVMNGVAPQGNEAAEAEDAIRGMGATVCPVRLTNRVAFARSLVTGHTAQEAEPEGKAASEVAQLHAFVCAQLQDQSSAQSNERTPARLQGAAA